MEYTYILEHIANKDFIHDINTNENTNANIFYMLCYHIETQCKYPFLQFILEKIPFCNGLVTEQFVLPHIRITNSNNFNQIALDKVNQMLIIMGINANAYYKGIIFSGNTGYILINLSINNNNKHLLSRNSPYWFVLPTEIINAKQVCGFNIDEDVTQLFTSNPQISILKNINTTLNYNLPDAVYTGCNDLKKSEFNFIFGNIKTKLFDSCNEYYFFNRLFDDVNNNTFINRYALFVEGNLYTEEKIIFSLTDKQIEQYYEPCITICYNSPNRYPDMLVKKYENFISLSYNRNE